MTLALDRASPLSRLERMKLVMEYGQISKQVAGGELKRTAKLRMVMRANEIRALLGASAQAVAAPDAVTEPDASAEPRKPTAHLYSHDEKRTKGKRQKANDAAVEILRQVQSGERDAADLDDADKATLAAYSGNGGALVGADGKKGSAYEYYTPTPIAEGIWDALTEMGFSGGKLLDPCAATGVFGATAPANTLVDSVELDATSGSINALINQGAGYSATVSAFEAVAAATEDETHDAVVTNVPFGTVADRGGHQLLDPKYQREPLEAYFILRSLDKLRPGGLAAFICPPRCVSGRDATEVKLRRRASLKAEFLGAYRLPNSVFGAADADTMTDVLFFRKHGRDLAEKISELAEQSPATLSEANILWSPFIEGQYFKGEGKRYVLGEFVPKNPEKFRDVDRVKNPASLPDVAKLLRKFPGSRIVTTLLDAAETLPIIYNEGDTLTQAGQTFVLRDGQWLALEPSHEDDNGARLLAQFADAYGAFEAETSYDNAVALRTYLQTSGQAMALPGWLAGALRELDKLSDDGARHVAWPAVLIGLAVLQVLDERGRASGTVFETEFNALSAAMRREGPGASRITGVDGETKRGLRELTAHYHRKRGFSALWRGDVQGDEDSAPISAEHSFEGLLYQSNSHWVSLEEARQIFGDDFDPIASDDWCLSADGASVARADDYYVGRYSDLISRLDADMANAPNETVRAKLLRQKALADTRVDRVDVSRIQFNLFSPYVELEEKAEFLRRFVHPSATVMVDEASGEKRIGFDIPGSKLSDDEKLIRRMGAYLKNGTVTLGGTKLDMGDEQGVKELRSLINKANEQFNGWARGNQGVITRMESRANDPTKLRFRQVEDESALPIPGMNPELTLHGYQNAYVRACSRDFSGINGHDVGLGKTFEALAAVQYAQTRGIKRKTLIVVPNSVLSNWRKEADKAYTSTDDCLYVGLRDGKVKSSTYDEDLNRVLENRHRKIFVTYEAFERIRLRDDSINSYERYLRSVDTSFAESEDKKAEERTKGKVAGLVSILSDKKGASPYLEDMGIDSLVIDEGHAFKNSSSTVDFKGGKNLSISPAAKRGVDAQAKAWVVRGKSARGDGVILLTASPITNSPLEIYSMMALSVGHDRVNDAFIGTSGADGFMDAVCVIKNEEDETIDGLSRATNVFKGLTNVNMLRNALHQVADVKTAKDVGAQMKVPDAPEESLNIALSEDVVQRLNLYKDAYRWAADDLAERDENRGDQSAYESVSELFGEEAELIGHPFNLINKMTMLIADPDLDRRLTRYLINESAMDQARAVVEQWNKKKPTEKRTRPGPNAADTEATKTKRILDENGDVVGHEYTMPVKVWIEDGAVCMDSMDGVLQDKLEALLEKANIEPEVSVPPKLAALLENVQIENASPRGVDSEGAKIPYAKQIIFCDLLGQHNKIRRLLARKAGIPSGAMAVITGQRNSSAEEILDVQDGFNAPGENNAYRLIIANEKAEVGINLQRGTQAIHHLTIGWTPDSLQQRNGRGVRQGNKTEQVTIYHYDADGTFDKAKRALVSSKADWIGGLMSAEGADQIEVTGGMTREQMEALVDVIGETDAVTKVQEHMAAREAEKRASTNREKQRVNLDTIERQNTFLAENAKAEHWVARQMGQLMVLHGQQEKLVSRLANSAKMSASARAKNEGLLAEIEVKVNGLTARIDAAATFYPARRVRDDQGQSVLEANEDVGPYSPKALIDQFSQQAKRGENRPDDLIRSLRRGRAGYENILIRINDDSDLAQEWASEVDMAESMRDQAVVAYERYADYPGGMPSGVAEAFKRGEGEMVGQRPVIRGAFVRDTDGELRVIVAVDPARAEGIAGGAKPVFSMPEASILYPGTPEHEAALQEAAAQEDDADRNGRTMNTFSDVVPEVAQRRETEALAAYSPQLYALPAPHFPIAIDSSRLREGAVVRQRIVDEQAGVIVRWESGKFVVPASLDLERIQDRSELARLRDYAIAHRLQLTPADVGHAVKMQSLMPQHFDTEAFKERLNALVTEVLAREDATVEDLHAQAEALVLSAAREAAPWFAFESVEVLDWLPGIVRYAVNNAIRPAREAIDARQDEPGPGNAGPDEGADPDEQVYVSGDTKVWKDRIKEYGSRHPAPGQRGYRWDGRNKQWVIARKAWDALLSDFPKAATALQLD